TRNSSQLGNLFNLGEDQNSIGLDLHEKYIWHANNRYRVKDLPAWKPGDVLGFLFNGNTSGHKPLTGSQRFTFYHNGVAVCHKWKLFRRFHFNSTDPYFVAVSLSTHQQCSFNFGTEPFRYPPK